MEFQYMYFLHENIILEWCNLPLSCEHHEPYKLLWSTENLFNLFGFSFVLLGMWIVCQSCVEWHSDDARGWSSHFTWYKNNIVCIRQPNQLQKKLFGFKWQNWVFFYKKKNYSNYFVYSFCVCVCCLDFDTTYPERKNEYRRSKEVTINELFPLQYNYFEVQIELFCRICATNG